MIDTPSASCWLGLTQTDDICSKARGYQHDGTLPQVAILATDTSLLETICTCTYRLILLTTYTDLITTNSCVVSAERDRNLPEIEEPRLLGCKAV